MFPFGRELITYVSSLFFFFFLSLILFLIFLKKSFTPFAPFPKSVYGWPQALKRGEQRFQNFKTQGIALKQFRRLDLNPQNKTLHPSCIQHILSKRLYKLEDKDSKMHHNLQPNSSHLLHTATDTRSRTPGMLQYLIQALDISSSTESKLELLYPEKEASETEP